MRVGIPQAIYTVHLLTNRFIEYIYYIYIYSVIVSAVYFILHYYLGGSIWQYNILYEKTESMNRHRVFIQFIDW